MVYSKRNNIKSSKFSDKSKKFINDLEAKLQKQIEKVGESSFRYATRPFSNAVITEEYLRMTASRYN
jgi:hypothetical protein